MTDEQKREKPTMAQVLREIAWTVKDPRDGRVICDAADALEKAEKDAAALANDAIKASSIAMAFMISHFGSIATASEYQQQRWKDLTAIHDRGFSALKAPHD